MERQVALVRRWTEADRLRVEIIISLIKLGKMLNDALEPIMQAGSSTSSPRGKSESRVILSWWWPFAGCPTTPCRYEEIVMPHRLPGSISTVALAAVAISAAISVPITRTSHPRDRRLD
jgi:hypothetical protein